MMNTDAERFKNEFMSQSPYLVIPDSSYLKLNTALIFLRCLRSISEPFLAAFIFAESSMFKHLYLYWLMQQLILGTSLYD